VASTVVSDFRQKGGWKMHGGCMGPRVVRKMGGMKGLVRLEGRISEAKGWWR
jgi:hypothetical protein